MKRFSRKIRFLSPSIHACDNTHTQMKVIKTLFYVIVEEKPIRSKGTSVESGDTPMILDSGTLVRLIWDELFR